MYGYTKEEKFPKRKLIVSLSCLLIAAVVFLTCKYPVGNLVKDTSVFKEDTTPVLSSPSSAEERKGIQPSAVRTEVVLDYFDGEDNEVNSMTKFEGVYRANQGMDCSFDREAFDVLASFSGKMSDVKEDNIFGKSVIVTSRDLSITYQSPFNITMKKDDKVSQKDSVAKAGGNIYNKELGNHLHIIVERNGKIIDPELMYGKTSAGIE